MPEAIKEGTKSTDVAAPDDTTPAAVVSMDLATDGAVEVKPPPATEPSLPVDEQHVKEQDGQVVKEPEQPPQENKQKEDNVDGDDDNNKNKEKQEKIKNDEVVQEEKMEVVAAKVDEEKNEKKVVETAPNVKEPVTSTSPSKEVNDKAEVKSTEKIVEKENVEKTQEKKTCSPKEELDEMVLIGSNLLKIKGDCYAAADVLSKACEKAAEIYGELSENCAELYYLYGCSMLECGKNENNILGEKMKEKDAEITGGDGDGGNDDDDDDDDEEDNNVEDVVSGADNTNKPLNEDKTDDSNKMEVDESGNVSSSAATAAATSETASTSNGVKDGEKVDNTEGDDDDDDDSSLKVAWEMFELAKVAYTRLDNKDKMADTLMKLGEVGIESGHPNALQDMINALEIRKQLHANKRIIPETHFNIGLGYSMFEMFDEAIEHFEQSKLLLEKIIENLNNKGDNEALKESKEIQDILPDLKEKIQDMYDSKKEKRKEMEEALKKGFAESAAKQATSSSTTTSSTENKPASNISHLIKRKRKLDEVTSDLPNKTLEEPKRKLKVLEENETIKTEIKAVEKPQSTDDATVQQSVEQMETEDEKTSVSNTKKEENQIESSTTTTAQTQIESNVNNKLEPVPIDNKNEKIMETVTTSNDKMEIEKNLDKNESIMDSQITTTESDKIINDDNVVVIDKTKNEEMEITSCNTDGKLKDIKETDKIDIVIANDQTVTKNNTEMDVTTSTDTEKPSEENKKENVAAEEKQCSNITSTEVVENEKTTATTEKQEEEEEVVVIKPTETIIDKSPLKKQQIDNNISNGCLKEGNKETNDTKEIKTSPINNIINNETSNVAEAQ